MNEFARRPVVVVRNAVVNQCEHCNVRHRSVCNVIEADGLDRLASVAELRRVEKGQVFIEEGQSARDFFNITLGTAKIYKMLPDGRQQITGFAGVGHFLGLAVSDTYAFSAEAIEDTEMCRFTRPKLRGLLEEFPLLEKRLLETACNELVAAQEQMLLLGRKTARERVATFLAMRLNEAVACGDPPNRLTLPMTRLEIADYLGLTIETVSRTLSRFKQDGKIALPSRDEVEILDPHWLSSVATGEDHHAAFI